VVPQDAEHGEGAEAVEAEEVVTGHAGVGSMGHPRA
jgi:hypothetical protein